MAEITAKKSLSPPRRDRTYPRVIKRGRHNSYQVKRPADHGIRHDGPATIKLVNLGRFRSHHYQLWLSGIGL